MLFVYILIILQMQPLWFYPYNMYNTDQDQNQGKYCLLYYAISRPLEIVNTAHQLIPYCLRLSEEIKHNYNVLFNDTTDISLNFVELRDKNITSQLLLSWSAPIDLAERYQIFLDEPSNMSLEEETLFHNCTPPWFGPYCRFAFDLLSFSRYPRLETVVPFNLGRTMSADINKVPCYKHLNCKTTFLCLDWREICDRKVDCLDGSDELHCWELEVNDCAENEYRCHNGQCIPAEFANDTSGSPDCLDQTDIVVDRYSQNDCFRDVTFRCEEHTCPPILQDFPCGDGQCTDQIRRHCWNGRNNLLRNKFSANATVCLQLSGTIFHVWCSDFRKSRDLYELPTGPILLGHVSFVFRRIRNIHSSFPIPFLVCYDEKLCHEFLSSTLYLNGMTCTPFSSIGLNENKTYQYLDTLLADVKNIFRKCLVTPNETHYCNHSTMYQCINSSKCISKYRLMDGINDCPFNDDETFNQSCSLKNGHYRIECWKSTNTPCFAPIVFQDRKEDCPNGEDELSLDAKSLKAHINYQKICDGKIDLLPVFIDDQYETDETNCTNWPCNNTYSRCDGFWLCRNGTDEVNCPSSTCPTLEHECIFPNDLSKLSCLPITRAGDGHVDCVGATDERYYCQDVRALHAWYDFRCWNSTVCVNYDFFCDGKKDCKLGDDEIYCMINMRTEAQHEVIHFVYRFLQTSKQPSMIYFKIYNMPNYAIQSITDTTISLPASKSTRIQSVQSTSLRIDPKTMNTWRCNRGLRIFIRMNDNTTRLACLCPPSYYSDSCEYQNQRVSLTLQIRATSDWRTVFTYIITLIDNEGNIESYDHIDYLAMRDCRMKFNVYLLYSTRPKKPSKDYSVRIHVFNKVTLKYRASWIYPLRFSFLPVHRLPILLTVPMYDVEPIQTCSLPCVHGYCFRYVNNQSSTFCRCESNWSGIYCTEKYSCNCVFNSLCIDKSICICPAGRFGPRCRLLQTSCHSYTCKNGGTCAPVDERYLPRHLVPPTCICRSGYVGNHCENQQQPIRMDISFHHKIPAPPSLLIHLIEVQHKAQHRQTSIMKKIGFDEDILTIYTSIPFDMAFAEIANDYYLMILREQRIVSAHISTQIVPSHRCKSIHELFDVKLSNQHLLKRIKHYHIPCRERLELVCFYDSVHICLCDLGRQTNCFEFNYNDTYDCRGYNWCENESHCFLDNPLCPTSSICACHRCYFGSKCQFSTKGSTLSLDIILGYRIIPNMSINRQPIIIKVAISVILAMCILGLISNFFAYLVFRTEEVRKVGCGVYLLSNSIISMVTMIVFTLKLGLLLASNTGGIKNRSFTQIQCISMDFILQVLLNSGDWLNACVSIERAINISKGVYFNKIKSKQMAKWTILVIFSFVICTHIHDLIHRRLIDDNDEQRAWCVKQYSSFVQKFDWAINIFHFFIPFIINCISALAIIVLAARTRSTTRRKQPYKEILREQFYQHKHLLISSGTLVVLTLPRLIISFSSGCMKSAQDSSLYLGAYLISFISPMLTFIIFVLPSRMYLKQFKDSFKQLWSQ